MKKFRPLADRILLKPGKLTQEEMEIMKTHVGVGVETIRSVLDRTPDAEFLVMAEQIASGHHEWFDGNGYPNGVKGEAIPLPARIGETRLIASPGFDFYPFFGPNVDGFDISASFFAFNFDLLYPFPKRGVEPYVGAGLVISRASVSASGLDPLPGGAVQLSNTDVGLNLKGGAFFGSAGSVRPFTEGVLVVGGNSTLLLKGGLTFTIGR